MPLDPQAKQVLDQLAALGLPPNHLVSPAQARLNMKSRPRAAGPEVAKVEDRLIPGPRVELPVRIYTPAGTGPFPILVWYHGGGWVVGDLDTHDQTCRFIAREAGVRVLAVAYRRAPEHPFPAPLEDAAATVRFAIENAGRLGADAARVAVGGDSAGGNLAAAAARLLAQGDGPAPAFQLLIYPVTDLSRKRRSYELFHDGFFLTESHMDWYRDNYLADEADALDPRASPLLAGDVAGLPPAHVAVAGFDVLRDEGEEYARRLEEASVPVTLSRHTGLIHGFANAVGVGRSSRAAMREVTSALRAALAG